jgi:hypothetical protein
MERAASEPLWRCAKCRRRFANRNQSHSCGYARPLREHFAGKPSSAKALFTRVRSVVEACGPVQVLSEKSRIAFHVRMSFMAVSIQKTGLRGHFVFASVHRHPRFVRVDTISPRNHVHHFRITDSKDIDSTFRAWVAQAYRVGQQQHLGKRAVQKRPSSVPT